MRKAIAVAIVLLVADSLPAAAQDDAELIRQLTDSWEQETNAENVDGLLGTLADDAIIIMPGAPPIRGKESIEAAYRSYYSTYDLEYSATLNEVEIYGETAYVWASVEGTREAIDGGEAEELAFNNVWMLKKLPTGWKFWRVIFNSTPLGS